MGNTTTAAERVRRAIDKGDMLTLAIQIVNSLDTFPPYTIENLLADVVKAKTAGRVIQQFYAAQAAEIAELRAKVQSAEQVAAQAKAMAESNTTLRKIAAHVPGKAWMQAKEKAGYGTAVAATQIDDPKVDEKWLEFVAVVPKDTALRAAAQAFDDERPVDEEWCRVNGFVTAPNPDYVRCELHRSTDTITHVWFNMRRKMVGVSDWDTQFDLPSIKTIGQLRHLLAALGGAK